MIRPRFSVRMALVLVLLAAIACEVTRRRWAGFRELADYHSQEAERHRTAMASVMWIYPGTAFEEERRLAEEHASIASHHRSRW